MALSSVTRVSDGIQKQYDFDFGYLRKSHVFVFVNNELRSFKWLGPFQIELLNFPQPDDTVTIRRLTDRVNRITTFTDGQTILAEDLNAADLQTFYIAQEMLDQIEERILAGEVSVIGSGYITAQWIQEQLAANIAGSTQFQAISDALDNEALARASALAAEAAARAAEIAQEAQNRAAAVAAEAATRADAVLALEQADLEAGQRLTVIESDLNDNALGLKAKIATLETTVVDLDNNKAEAGEVTAIRSEIDDPATGLKARATSLEERTTAVETNKAEASALEALEATVTDPTTGLNSKASQTDLNNLSTVVDGKASASALSALDAQVNNPTTGLGSKASQVFVTDAVATEAAARTSQINAANSRIDGAEAGITSLGVTVTNLQTNKAEASALSALTAEVAARAAGATEAINRNPTFSSRFTGTAIPPGWSDWANGPGTETTHPTLPDRIGFRSTNNTPLINKGLIQFVPVVGGRQYLLRATARRLGGSFEPSGVLMGFYGQNRGNYWGDNRIKFSTATTTEGTVLGAFPDGTNTWELLFTAPASADEIALYAMNAWEAFGPATAGDILWYECAIYPTGSPEFRAAKARADIITESSARVSGDSANATTIEQNRAAFSSQEQFPNLIADTSFSTQNWQLGWDGPSGLQVYGLGRNLEGAHVPGVLDVAFRQLVTGSWDGPGIGFSTVYDLATYAPGGSLANAPTVTPGQRIYASAYVAYDRLEAVSVVVMWLDAAGNYLSEAEVGRGGVSFGARGGLSTMQKVGGYLTVPSGVSKASIFFRAHVPVGSINPYMWVAAPQLCRVEPGTSGDIPWSKQSSAVTFLREALATGNTSLARLLLAVNTTNNVATIEAVAQEGSGVWNGSAITLQANLIKLLAQDIQFGSRTQFEDGRGTIYNTEAGKRLRLLGPFGASNDLVLWYGNSSIALQAETKTNGIFAIATDGLVYLGNSSLSAPLSASHTGNYVKTDNAGTCNTGPITINPSGGSGGYTYNHQLRVTRTTGPIPSLTNTNQQTFAVTGFSPGVGQEAEFIVITTVTDSAGRNVQYIRGGALIWSA